MAWIKSIPDDEWAGGPLEDLYAKVVDRTYGRVDNIMSIHSLNPKAMTGHIGVYGSAMSGTATLRKVERELVALVVSQVNGCHY